MRVEAIKTPVAMPEVLRALALAFWRLFDVGPTKATITLLGAQFAHETSRGRSCYNFCLGNAKTTAAWDGDFCERPCNELLTEKQAADALSRAGTRDDGTPDVVLGGLVGRDRVVWFYPSNPASRFRAFPTLEAGAIDYLDLLRNRFEKAWPDILIGDPVRFATTLRAQRYYTDTVERYSAGLVSLVREFSRLDIDLTAPPRDPTGALAAVQSDSLRGLSWETLK